MPAQVATPVRPRFRPWRPTVTPPLADGRSAPDERPDDRALLDAVRGGDMEAYGILYSRHLAAVRRVARRVARDQHEADDITGDVFDRTLNAIRRGAGPTDDALPYFLRSARHVATNLRCRKDSGRADPTPNDRLDRSVAADWPQSGDAEIALLQLPARHQQVLWATCVEGRSPAELAATHGVEPGCITSLTLRARRSLRRAYLLQRTQRPEPTADCSRIRSAMPTCMRDDAHGSATTSVEAHVDDCTMCADVYAEMREIDNSMASVGWPALIVAAVRQLCFGGPSVTATIAKPIAALLLAGGAVTGALVAVPALQGGEAVADVTRAPMPDPVHTSPRRATAPRLETTRPDAIVGRAGATIPSVPNTTIPHVAVPETPLAVRPIRPSVVSVRPAPEPTTRTPATSTPVLAEGVVIDPDEPTPESAVASQPGEVDPGVSVDGVLDAASTLVSTATNAVDGVLDAPRILGEQVGKVIDDTTEIVPITTIADGLVTAITDEVDDALDAPSGSPLLGGPSASTTAPTSVQGVLEVAEQGETAPDFEISPLSKILRFEP